MAPQSVPPSLPPSVEEAYRRKCVQLKNRTNEVEDANDAARLRLARIKRQVEKLRIERAFLLEQLAKRTSTSVEDSEGSPSPPPTDSKIDIPPELDANPRKPKDRPLRTKRGHRKPSGVGDGDASKNAGDSNQPGSPGSDTQSQPAASQAKEDSGSGRANGVSKSKGPANAFELYCAETRPSLEATEKEEKEGEMNIEEELAKGWKSLSETERDDFLERFEQELTKFRQDKENAEEKKDEEEDKAETEKAETQDEDVEMGNYDTEDQEATGDKEADD